MVNEPYDEEYLNDEQFWYVASWEQVMEASGMVSRGEAREMKYAYEPSHGSSYVIRFYPTERFDIHNCFNYWEFGETEESFKNRKLVWHPWK
jgi:hypothetical protein